MQFIFSLLCVATVVSAKQTFTIETRPAKCILPPYPKNGFYVVAGDPSAYPGDDLHSVILNVTCYEEYSMTGSNVVYCKGGLWSTSMPRCDRCGRIPEGGAGLPWHVTINIKAEKGDEKNKTCGGSIISNHIIVSGAFCFMQKLPSNIEPSRYTVIAPATQQSWEVSDVKIPVYYNGIGALWQSDIALVILNTDIEYSTHVHPVCVDFDTNFESQQLQQGNLGKVVDWSVPLENRSAFRVLEIPYMSIEQCINRIDPKKRWTINSDKFCAGHAKEPVLLCEGYDGAGLSFPHEHRGEVRHYLRGVMSVLSPTQGTNATCAATNIFTFTQVKQYENFIREYFVKPIISKCVLPPYPEHGTYVVSNVKYAKSSQGFQSLQLTVTCDPGYRVWNEVVSCQDGIWSHSSLDCVRFCKLDEHPSVKYHCLLSSNVEDRRACNTLEPSGTVIKPECNSPNYYSTTPLPFMRCIDGSWNYVAVCDPECGRILGNETILPWHVMIMKRNKNTGFRWICDGTIISNNIILSGATCFLPKFDLKINPSLYNVVGGEEEQFWEEVSDVKVPANYNHMFSQWQSDIALVILETPLKYTTEVQPVCINFDTSFERRQLQEDNFGKISHDDDEFGFGAMEFPYITTEKCIAKTSPQFRKLLTSDKFCTGYADITGAVNCRKHNMGAGLAFTEKHGGVVRHYLLGVESLNSHVVLPPENRTSCSATSIYIFTQITKHENFIKEYFSKPVLSGQCVLPPYPMHGTYVVSNMPNATPGQAFPSLQLNVTCDPGYGVSGNQVIFCQGGTWSHTILKCVRVCKLDQHPSVHYHCLLSGDVEGQRTCNALEPSGTVVRPECNSPNYYSSTLLPFMRCNDDGRWNYVAICNPECGYVTPDGVGLIIDGRPALRGELPWHVGIYRKSTRPAVPHEQICGGSLVTNSIIISAAHCFWNDVGKQQPAANYAVAIAKLYRGWDNPLDKDAQKSDVKAINLPPRFLGSQANFQHDIAVVVLKTPFVFYSYVRPVCLNFDVSFSRRQLQHGKLGKVAGWGLTGEDGQPSKILKVVELPYVNIEECIDQSPLAFRKHITGDKICAGYRNGTALCRGDSGGGLAFPAQDRGTDRFYLRGIVSTAPRSEEHFCNAFTFTAFTGILTHQDFINQYL